MVRNAETKRKIQKMFLSLRSVSNPTLKKAVKNLSNYLSKQTEENYEIITKYNRMANSIFEKNINKAEATRNIILRNKFSSNAFEANAIVDAIRAVLSVTGTSNLSEKTRQSWLDYHIEAVNDNLKNI
jgi:hypothetical protein